MDRWIDVYLCGTHPFVSPGASMATGFRVCEMPKYSLPCVGYSLKFNVSKEVLIQQQKNGNLTWFASGNCKSRYASAIDLWACVNWKLLTYYNQSKGLTYFWFHRYLTFICSGITWLWRADFQCPFIWTLLMHGLKSLIICIG